MTNSNFSDDDLQRAIELSEREAIQRRIDARNKLEPQMTGDSISKYVF